MCGSGGPSLSVSTNYPEQRQQRKEKRERNRKEIMWVF
jgi:hypothetical protein